MRFQQLNSLGIYQVISLVVFGLILLYLSFTDYKKLSIGGWDIGLLTTYTAINFLFCFYKFGVSFILDGIKALILSFVFFLLIISITKGRGVGVGDMLFFCIPSINLGIKNVFEALILAFSLGAIICLILIFTGKLNFKDRIPFIPFLSLGIYLSMFLDFTYI